MFVVAFYLTGMELVETQYLYLYISIYICSHFSACTIGNSYTRRTISW